MKAKFFMRAMLETASVLCMEFSTVFADAQVSRIPDDKRPATKDYYTYCMSHRDYRIDISELNANAFVSDLEGSGLTVEVRPSCNFSRRINEDDIRGVVIHYTNGSAEGALAWWQTRYPGTSAHYIIRRDGSIIQAVPEIYAAFHLGCYWSDEFCSNCPATLCDNSGYFYDPSETTIAVELENAGPLLEEDGRFTDIFRNPISPDSAVCIYDGSDPLYHASRFYEAYSDAQLAALEKLLANLNKRYGDLIVLGHSDIQQVSVDPGPAFPETKFFK